MVPLFLKKNTRTHEQSFEMRRVIVPHTYDRWHHHAELELMHIIQGSGTRYIGDSIEGFAGGDLVLVGSQLPHFWRSDAAYYDADNQLETELVLVHFLEDFAGKDFMGLPEIQPVKELIQASRRGIQVTGQTREAVSALLLQMVDMHATERLLTLVQILWKIARSGEYRVLSGPAFAETGKAADTERINHVYDYIFNNFTREIPLETIAKIANMNTTAFCRYFKNATFKSFTQVLNDVRISHACKLLLQPDSGISSAGYQCGFNNISYFIKTFKKSQGITPLEYKRLHAG